MGEASYIEKEETDIFFQPGLLGCIYAYCL